MRIQLLDITLLVNLFFCMIFFNTLLKDKADNRTISQKAANNYFGPKEIKSIDLIRLKLTFRNHLWAHRLSLMQ